MRIAKSKMSFRGQALRISFLGSATGLINSQPGVLGNLSRVAGIYRGRLRIPSVGAASRKLCDVSGRTGEKKFKPFEAFRMDEKIWIGVSNDGISRALAPVGSCWQVKDLKPCLVKSFELSKDQLKISGASGIDSIYDALRHGISLEYQGKTYNLKLDAETINVEDAESSKEQELYLLEAKQKLLHVMENHSGLVCTKDDFKDLIASEIEHVRTLDPSFGSADWYLDTLVTLGIVNLDKKKQKVFLKPQRLLELTDRYHSSVPLKPQTFEKAPENRNERNKDILSTVAKWAIASSILGFHTFLFLLVYVYFSWDIIEPVTYFVNAIVSCVGYFWFLITRKSFRYGNILQRLVRK